MPGPQSCGRSRRAEGPTPSASVFFSPEHNNDNKAAGPLADDIRTSANSGHATHRRSGPSPPSQPANSAHNIRASKSGTNDSYPHQADARGHGVCEHTHTHTHTHASPELGTKNEKARRTWSAHLTTPCLASPDANTASGDGSFPPPPNPNPNPRPHPPHPPSLSPPPTTFPRPLPKTLPKLPLDSFRPAPRACSTLSCGTGAPHSASCRYKPRAKPESGLIGPGTPSLGRRTSASVNIRSLICEKS